MQRRVAIFTRNIQACLSADEKLAHAQIPSGGRQVQRSVAIVVSNRHRGGAARLNQKAHNLQPCGVEVQ
jgi:hypothetical protein